MKKLLSIIAFCLFIAPISCTSELNLTPVSQLTSASFWQSKDDVTGYVNGMYSRFRSQTNQNLFLLGEGRSDVMGASALQNDFNYARYIQNTLDRNNAGPSWAGLYTAMHDANLLLKYVPTVTFPAESEKNEVLAQAYAMRAFLYFVMVRTWGGVPIVLQPTESYDAEAVNRTRASVDDTFKQIKEDIEKSLALFPTNNFINTRHAWSKPAVNALKGEVFLWTGKKLTGGQADLNTALAALQEVTKSDVALLDNFGSVFDYQNKGNKEILFAVSYLDLQSDANYNQTMYISGLQVPVGVDKATLDKIGSTSIDNNNAPNNWTPSAFVRSQFTTDDLRKDKSFVEIYAPDGNNQSKYVTSVTTKFKGTVVSGIRKFLDDVIIYRYADVLLMTAEAKNALGMDPAVEINQVRKRAYGADYEKHAFKSVSKEVNDDAILKERLLEMAFEGKRWWDLVRFNKAFDMVPSLQTLKGKNELLLFPISQTTISVEPKVEQNPGY